MVGRIPAAGEFQDHVLEKFKGLRNSGPSSLVDDIYLSEAKNVLVGKNGELYKRPGMITYNATTGATFPQNQLIAPNVRNHLIGFNRSVTGFASGRVYNSINSGQTWSPISSATNHLYQPGINHGGNLYGVSDVGIWQWDGTTFTDFIGAAFPGSAKKPVLIQFRMFIINAQGNIQYSEPGSFNSAVASSTTVVSWPNSNIVGFPSDNQTTMGIIPFRDNLVIFRSHSIFVLQMAGASTPSSWSLRELSFQIGSTHENAMVVFKDILFFSSLTGVYATDLSTLTRISESIDKVFAGRSAQIMAGTGANISYDFACPDDLAVYNNKLFCIINIMGLNAKQHQENAGVSQAAFNSTLLNLEPRTNAVYVYDLVQRVWTEFEFNLNWTQDLAPFDPALGSETWKTQPQQMYVIPSSNRVTGQYINEGIYFQFTFPSGLGPSGRLLHYSESTHVRDLVTEAAPYIHAMYLPYTDPDGNYKLLVRTANMDFDLPNQLKRCPVVSLNINSGESHNTASVNASVNCNYYVDDVLVPSTTIPINSIQNKATKIRGPGFFRKMQIELQDSSAGYVEIVNMIPSVRAKRKLTEIRT